MTESGDDQRAHSLDCLDLSSINKASFLSTAQPSYGNPLHSTAFEEALLLTDVGGGERKDVMPIRNTAAKKGKRVSAHRKRREKAGDDKEVQKGRGTSTKTVKTRPIKTALTTPVKEKGRTRKKGAVEQEGKSKGEKLHSDPCVKSSQPVPSSDVQMENVIKHVASRKTTQKRNVGQRSAPRDMKTGGLKKKRKRQSESRKVNSNQAQGESDVDREGSESDKDQQNDRSSLCSEDITDEDLSWHPHQKEARVHSLDTPRKSAGHGSCHLKPIKDLSSASGSTGPNWTSRNGEKKRRARSQKAGTQWEVVLDSFLEFCLQYRESVESKVVKQAIDSFISSVEVQIMEKITLSKEVRILKRDNTKVDSLINEKRQRLLDAKYELIRAEQQLLSQQKEEAKLELRLADLRRGQAFLRNITELNKQYLAHQRTHPKQTEEYGASSLPALLLETKCVLEAENQLKEVNQRLSRALEQFKE
ncbi:centromere protein U [Lampris incognitus]|uniref:centromere protein U n=1 Tax=Lampris incognitus TaxID=2546036 RepID=UPI0024B50622|nr:centromere protein U [Lampris incognitus]